MSGSRKKNDYSADLKKEVVKRVIEGEPKASIARIYKVPESTLRGWVKTELASQAKWNNNNRGSLTSSNHSSPSFGLSPQFIGERNDTAVLSPDLINYQMINQQKIIQELSLLGAFSNQVYVERASEEIANPPVPEPVEPAEVNMDDTGVIDLSMRSDSGKENALENCKTLCKFVLNCNNPNITGIHMMRLREVLEELSKNN